MAKMKAYLTVKEVQNELGFKSDDAVRKLISRGKLAAVKLSAHKTVVTRGALESYKRRNGIQTNWKTPGEPEPPEPLPVEELRNRFVARVGCAPEEFLAEWKADGLEDSALNMQRAANATAIIASERALVEPVSSEELLTA